MVLDTGRTTSKTKRITPKVGRQCWKVESGPGGKS